jgi:RNA polymerase sigma-70 factor (ECF subfamily)
MPAHASERELREIDDCLRRVRAGEAAAFEPVVRRFQRPLRAWLAMRAPPGVDADDLAQQALVIAYTRLTEFQPGTDFAAWLFTIAAFQLRGETTRLRRVADYHSRYAPEIFAQALDRRVEQAPGLAEARLDSLRECVQSLAEPLRRFIAWRYDEGIPLEEMAARSGRSVAAVKKQLWSLRQSLKLCVERRLALAEGSGG